MATQVQNRRGTTAEHSTFTGAVGEVTIDTDKDTVVVHDGATAGGRPVLREDQSNLPTSAPTTGIYNNSGALALSTSGTGRLFIDSAGLVGIGTSAPSEILDAYGSIRFGSPNIGRIYSSDGTRGSIQISAPNDSTNRSVSYGNNYYINSSSNWVQENANIGGSAIELRARNNNYGTFLFRQKQDPDLGGAERIPLVIDASGNVGIGITSPGAPLHVVGNDGIAIQSSAQTNAFLIRPSASSADGIRFTQAGGVGDRLAIDSSGRLLVGTSSAPDSEARALAQIVSGSGPKLVLGNSTSGTYTSGATAGEITFIHNSGGTYGRVARIEGLSDGTTSSGTSKPGRLVFSVTADGASSPTERMRISQDGACQYYTNTSFNVRTARTLSTADALAVHNAATSIASGTKVFQVLSDGDVENTNNSYGAISDSKLKENVTNANSQWNDLKAIQVRNYNFKPETGYGTHTQIGLIAQEVELVSPGLVSESPDRDEDGNDLGTVTKSVNYSVLYMKAVKALQEAMERIETLEQRLNDAGIN